MGKIWIKSADPSKQCCGCEGRSGPCDSCLSCPLYVIPAGQNAVVDGPLADCLQAIITGDLASVHFNATEGNSRATIEDDEIVSYEDASCALAAETNDQGSYSFLLKVNKGDIYELDTTILQPQFLNQGLGVFIDAQNQDVLCVNPLTGTIGFNYHLEHSRGFIQLVSEVLTGATGVSFPSGALNAFSVGVQVLSQSLYNDQITPIYQITEACTVLPEGGIYVPGISLNYYTYNNIAQTNFFVNDAYANSLQLSSNSDHIERSFLNNASWDCPDQLPADFTADLPIGIGQQSNVKFKVTGIFQTTWSGAIGSGLGGKLISSKYVGNACMYATATNLSSIKLFDPSNGNLSIVPRFRPFNVLGDDV